MLSIDYVKELHTLEHLFLNAEHEDHISWEQNEPLAMCGMTGSGKTTAVLRYCEPSSDRLYFSFHNLAADFAPKMFSEQYPDIFLDSCGNWSAFFDCLQNHFKGKYHVLAFDDMDDRNDKDTFIKLLTEYIGRYKRRNPFLILMFRDEESVTIPCFKYYLRSYMPADLRRSFPKLTDEDRIRLYSITDS